jgi:hypothetical protein
MVAAANTRALENLLYAFRQSDATAAARARSLGELGVLQSSLLSQLQRAGAIKPGDSSATWYLDERALRDFRGRSAKRVWVAMAIAGIAMVAAFTLALLAARR